MDALNLTTRCGGRMVATTPYSGKYCSNGLVVQECAISDWLLLIGHRTALSLNRRRRHSVVLPAKIDEYIHCPLPTAHCPLPLSCLPKVRGIISTILSYPVLSCPVLSSTSTSSLPALPCLACLPCLSLGRSGK